MGTENKKKYCKDNTGYTVQELNSLLKSRNLIGRRIKTNISYLIEYRSHFFVPENQSKNGGATYARGYVK